MLKLPLSSSTRRAAVTLQYLTNVCVRTHVLVGGCMHFFLSVCIECLMVKPTHEIKTIDILETDS